MQAGELPHDPSHATVTEAGRPGSAGGAGPGTVVAIDLGTTVSVVAARPARGPARILAIDGAGRSPSVVAIDDAGRIRAGAEARAIARRWPERACAAPTRHLGEVDPAVIAGQPWEFEDLVAALIGELVAGAARTLGGPTGPVHLTYPAGWGRDQRDGLRRAAQRSGIRHAVLVPAPVAAVMAHETLAPLAPGGAVAVLVLGAASAQAAVVRAGPDGRPVLAGRPGLREDVGAAYFDELVTAALAARLGQSAARALAWSDAPEWAEAATALAAAGRQAKERLSDATTTEVLIEHPDGRQRLTFTRPQLEALIHPSAVRLVRMLRQVVVDAGFSPGGLSAVHLAGGGSATPLIAMLATQALGGLPVVRHHDPAAALAAGTALLGAPDATWTPTPPGLLGGPGEEPTDWGFSGRVATRGAPVRGPNVDALRRWPPRTAAAPPTASGAPLSDLASPPSSILPPPRPAWRRPALALAGVVVAAALTVGAVLLVDGGSSSGGGTPLTASQLSKAVLSAGEVGQGFSAQDADAACGTPPQALATKEVILSDPGYGEITESLLSYSSAATASAAAQALRDAAPNCVGSSSAAFSTLSGLPAVCQSSWAGAGPVSITGNAAGTTSGFAGVFRCGTTTGLLLAYPEQEFEFTTSGFFQLFQDAGADLSTVRH